MFEFLDSIEIDTLAILGAIVTVFEILGILSAIRAVLTTRTAQGAIAWTTALLTIPVISVPLFWIFGRNKFNGYLQARRSGDWVLDEVAQRLKQELKPYEVSLGEETRDARVMEQLASLPFTRGNRTELLIDGAATFDAIFKAINSAQDYVLVQFYIYRNDQLGQRLLAELRRCINRGVRVYLLYDEVGSASAPNSYFNQMVAAGIEVSGFRTTRGPANRFQLNFRNHRKIVIVDGRIAFVGGHNVGDEYLGADQRLSPWRDTHLEIVGPAVQATQLSFVEDWYWATGSVPELEWTPRPADGDDKIVFVLPSGPADRFETCGLFFTHAINSARRRIWIASPYFVPDAAIIGALQLAAMRGVDVRVLLAGKADHLLTHLAAIAYVKEVSDAGVKLYRHQKGFMHQKVVLIDDAVSTVGTANFDNRSFRLNFEISVLTIDDAFGREVEQMLNRDLEDSVQLTGREFDEAPFRLRFGSRVARLASPIL